VEHQFPAWSGRVDGLSQALETAFLLLQKSHDLDQVAEAPTQPVKPPDTSTSPGRN
jgi:hypothetical protein